MEENAASIEIKAVKTINYVTYQAYVLQKEATHVSEFNPFSFIKSILLKNLSNEDLYDLTLKFDVVPDFMHISNIHLASLEKGNRGTLVNRFEIFLDPLKIYSLTESMPGSIRVTLLSKMGEVLGVNNVNVRFDPIEASASEDRMEQILASFVTPNDDKVQEIVSLASKYRLENFGSDAFNGYLTHDPNEVLKDLASIYETLNRCNIRYITPPASYDKIFQRVRLPKDVLINRAGTCLDTSLLFASVIEAIGLRPILITLNGHAMVGAWLDEEENFQNTVEDNSQTLINAISRGFEHICVIETTSITSAEKISFQESKDIAIHTLTTKAFWYALDIARCRNELFWPIPSPKIDENGEKSIVVPSLKDKDANDFSRVDENAKRYLPEEARKNKTRYDYWEDKLLDLNLSNKLLNFKCRESTLQIMVDDAEEFMKFLSNNDRINLGEVESVYPFEGKGLVNFDDVTSKTIIKEAFDKKQILAFSHLGIKNEGPKKLSRKANTSLEESGCNPLFISIGLIRWFDNELSASHFKGAMYAPLLLLPVRIPRRKTGAYYTLDYDIEDLSFNQTLFEYLKANFGLDFSSLNSIPKGEDGKVDIRIIFNEVRKIIAPMKNWLLLEKTSTLSLFSFSHFVMWSDLKYNRERFLQNEIVSSFANGEKYFSKLDEEKKDVKEIKNDDVIMPLNADSSQIKAIYDAEKGESFILDGPPGTGKSQTIANMIVNFLYHGKKVLFVAEKEVALDVVKRRLDDLNLGQFVLELANIQEPKSQVLDTYQKLLSLGGPVAPAENFDEVNQKIEEKQKELNSKISSLHEKKDYIYSPYQAILIYLENENKGDVYRFSHEYLSNLTLGDYEKAKVLLQDISTTSYTFDTYYSSPFLPFQNRNYSMEYRDELKKELEELLPSLEQLKLDLHNVVNPSKTLEQSKKTAKGIFNILNLMREGDNTWHNCILDGSFLEKEEDIRKAFYLLLENAKERDKILTYFNKDFLEKDALNLQKEYDEVAAKGGLKHLFAYSSFKKKFKGNALGKEALKEENLSSCIASLNRMQTLNEEISKFDPYIKYILNAHKFETYPDGEETIRQLEKTISLSKEVSSLDYLPNKEENFVSYLFDMSQATLFSQTINKYLEHYVTFNKKKEELLNEYSFDLDLYPDGKTYFGTIYSKIRSANGMIGNLAEWTSLLLKMDEAEGILSKEYFSLFKNGLLKEENLLGNYEKSIASSIISKRFQEDQLGLISGKEMDNLVHKYASDIKEFASLSTVMTAAKISSSYPSDAFHFAESTTYNQLAKLSKNGGRGVSLRQIFHNYKDVIQNLTPCFMMSPISVSQFLDVDDYQFDVVIFDEASQIPTSEAIPSIARAKSVIIAGDEQQMPPTSFFTSTIGSNEGDAFSSLDEDLESLLDDAIVLGLPRKRLLWHYRSRHEALISFSNNKFYDNSLLTFPSPKNDANSISFIQVKGCYERGRGVNRLEAKEVVKEVIRRLKDKDLRTHSIGIITFNEAQQNVIDDMLEKEMSKNSLSNLEPGGEKIFVKNLENVQGDERDAILFSTTYGPDKNGTFSLNFGPLSLKKGERRLNVAISRSREEMIVFSSMDPEEIKAERAKNNGAQCLKDFLLFAKKGYDYLPLNSVNSYIKEKGIETYLATDLRKLGYEVKENIGESSFKIDLGIALKESPTDYLLGIIIDNEQFANMPCRDRHLNEPSILSRLGWNIFNVYSNEYLDHRQELVQKIVARLNEIQHGSKEEEKSDIHVRKPLFIKQIIRKNSVPYTLSEEKCSPKDLASYLYSLIYFEGPISLQLINRRYCEATGKKRVGNTSQKEIQIALAAIGKFIRHFMNDGTAFYVVETFDEAQFVNYRLDDENKSRRTLSDICYQEVANCAADILKEQGEMDIADLAKQISLVFGFKTLLASKNAYLQRAIKDSSCKRNRIRVRENRVSLAD